MNDPRPTGPGAPEEEGCDSTPTTARASAPPPSYAPTSRRDLLRWSGFAALGAVAGPLVPGVARAASPLGVRTAAGSPTSATGTATRAATANAATATTAAAATTFSPLRPPATPLAVRSPYLSTWQFGDTLTGTWPTFWNGRITAFCGIARIDGTAYLFCGAPSSSVVPNTMAQVSLELTGTRSIYTFDSGGVTLTVTFFSPVDVTELKRQSVPFSYVTMQAASSDGASHAVQLYLDISAEWTHGDSGQLVTWTQQATGGGNLALSFDLVSPNVLAEDNDQASWGTVVLTAPDAGGTSWQIGQDVVVRGAMVASGALAGTVDADQPRPIDDNWPVLGFSRDLGTVTAAVPSAQFQLAVGHVRTPAVSFLGQDLNPWWTHYWGSNWQAMADWFLADHRAALASATALDAKIAKDASKSVGGGTVGTEYAALCALALRQAVGGTELVDFQGSPWAFLKEISSDGNVSTVDVTYPASPAYLYLSPAYLQLLLEPLVYYAENGWIEQFAEHDLGARYPNASGGVSNGQDTQEDMPVEETGNMLIMTAAVLQRIPEAKARAFAKAHYPVFSQWGQYLVANALDPGYQNQTDDFTGFIAHSVNLALKGIVGLGAMSVVAGFAGERADQASYLSTAYSHISQWVSKGEDPDNPVLDLAYGDSGSWSLKYNAFPDRLLGLDLVPTGIRTQQAAWYEANAGAYGVLLDPRNDYTKGDWEMWTAAWLADQTAARNTLISGVYGFANSTGQRVPFSDWYVVADAAQRGFQNRPVVGGMYGLALTPARSATAWYKIRNHHSGLVLAVSGMSLADSADVTQWADDGTVDHLWALIENGDGTCRIVNRNSGKVLAVNNQSLSDGAPVQQYQDNGTPDHLWRIVRASRGRSRIQNVHSGLALAVSGGSTAQGAQITQWDDNGAADQLWTLVAA